MTKYADCLRERLTPALARMNAKKDREISKRIHEKENQRKRQELYDHIRNMNNQEYRFNIGRDIVETKIEDVKSKLKLLRQSYTKTIQDAAADIEKIKQIRTEGPSVINARVEERSSKAREAVADINDRVNMLVLELKGELVPLKEEIAVDPSEKAIQAQIFGPKLAQMDTDQMLDALDVMYSNSAQRELLKDYVALNMIKADDITFNNVRLKLAEIDKANFNLLSEQEQQVVRFQNDISNVADIGTKVIQLVNLEAASAFGGNNSGAERVGAVKLRHELDQL